MHQQLFCRRLSQSLSVCLAIFALTAAAGQTTETSQSSDTVLLGQLENAFSGGQAIHSVRIAGNATWHSGNQEDTGSAVLTASDSGQAEMQLELEALGQRTETQSGTGVNATCSWTGNDGVVHPIQTTACWIPVLWFLPAFSLQPSLFPNGVSLNDLGSASVAGASQNDRYAQIQLSTGSGSNSVPQNIANQTEADMALDPHSMLPVDIAYSIPSDSGAPVSIPVQILYSNYQSVEGVTVPFLIQRYVNGVLQLQINVSSVSVN